jgi:Flp pilus assembly protein TadG
MPSPRRSKRQARRAATVVELALVVPFLAFLLTAATDFCRAFYFSQVVTNCARNGALYASDPYSASLSQYKTIEEAARADAGATLGPQLTVSTQSGTDSGGDYVRVTVSYPFQTITRYPGIPQVTTLTRSAVVRPAKVIPQ